MKLTRFALAVAAACGSESKPAPPPAPSPPPQVAKSVEPRATVQLPAKRFDLSHVLGHTKPDVDKELGHGEHLEDGPWLYDGFEQVAVNVLFDGDRAAFVSIEPADYHGAPADLAAVKAWMHAPHDADYDHVHNFDFVVGIWAPGMQTRQLQRREFAHSVASTLKQANTSAAANGTDLEISAPPGQCDRRVLRALITSVGGVGELKKLGFAMMECSGEDNTVTKL